MMIDKLVIIRDEHDFNDLFEVNKLALDTGVWWYIEGVYVDPSDRYAILYSKLFKEILNHSGKIYLNWTIISEFANRVIRTY